MRRLVLKRIGVLSLAKIYAVLMGVVGFVIGVVYTIMGSVLSAVTQQPGIGIGMGVLGIIVMPVLYAVLGFISGAVGAWVYNLVAGWIGGLELEFE